MSDPTYPRRLYGPSTLLVLPKGRKSNWRPTSTRSAALGTVGDTRQEAVERRRRHHCSWRHWTFLPPHQRAGAEQDAAAANLLSKVSTGRPGAAALKAARVLKVISAPSAGHANTPRAVLVTSSRVRKRLRIEIAGILAHQPLHPQKAMAMARHVERDAASECRIIGPTPDNSAARHSPRPV